MRAYIIVDLGFGDSGKGLLTDHLARHLQAGLVVRYNGGAQAGHNVVTPDGRHHTFSQFGSGTFIPYVRTYISRYVVIHPQALLVEGDILAQKGIRDIYSRLCVSEHAPVITPFHQAANRIREALRGADRHGSCGVGVGEVVEDGILHPEQTVLAGDLKNPDVLWEKVRKIRDRKRAQVTALFTSKPADSVLESELGIFLREDVIESWISSVSRINELGLVVPDSVLESWLQETDNVIFEGAQGVLLDEEAGFHPYTTWSRCTTVNAVEIIQQMAPGSDVYRLGVLRSYSVRHGPGPLPTETDELAPVIREHNQHNQWQGSVRYGWFDLVMARYALEVTGKVDLLAVTHMDVLPRLETWKYCIGYEPQAGTPDISRPTNSYQGRLAPLPLLSSFSLEQREKISQALFRVSPILASCRTDEDTVIRKMELLLERPVGIISRGPSAGNVQMLKSLSPGA